MQPPFIADSGQRSTPAERVALARKLFGVEVVDGFHHVTADVSRAQKQEGLLASFRAVQCGWRVSHEGGQRFEWQTYPVPEDLAVEHVVFVFPMATGWGKPYPEPSGYFEIEVNGQRTVVFRETKYSDLWEQGECALCYDVKRSHTAGEGEALRLDPWIDQARMASFGVALLRVPRRMVQPGQPAKVRLCSRAYFPSSTWVRIDRWCAEPGKPSCLHMLNWWDGLTALAEGRKRHAVGDTHVWFGDLHGHSYCGMDAACGLKSDEELRGKDCATCELDSPGGGCGYGSVAANYRYARDVANMDLFGLAEHDFQMAGPEDWAARVRCARSFSEAGRFSAIPSWEWTSVAYGHRNVYVLEDHVPCVGAAGFPGRYNQQPQMRPAELWAQLEAHTPNFVSVPHHPPVADHPFNWDLFDPRYDRLVEVFSGWGNHEDADGPLRGHGSDKYEHLTVRRAVQRGLRFGMIASSDAHDGCPGSAQGSGLYTWANKFSEVGSGFAAVLCDDLDRESLIASMRARHCYAVTGARIGIDFRVNDAAMGSEVRGKGPRRIAFKVQAPSPIAKIAVVRNGVDWVREWCDRCEESFVVTDESNEDHLSYYLRVTLADREMAWSSPIWVDREG